MARLKSTIFFIIATMSAIVLSSSKTVHNQLIKEVSLSVSAPSKNDGQTPVTPGKKPARVTIWVHGTKTSGGFSSFVHAAPLGLRHVNELSRLYRLKNFTKALATADPDNFPLEHFYAFGWSGALNFEKRKDAARNLYQAIKKLMSEYEVQYGCKPDITLITHSHGGNVALNLAAVKDADTDFTLRAILLACPVQHETKKLVHDILFSKIYSFYSTSDMLQIIDPQGLYKTEDNDKRHVEFSERQFPACDNLYQAQLKINGHGIAHIGFILERFTMLLPQIINQIDCWAAQEPIAQAQERILQITLPEKPSLLFALPMDSEMINNLFDALQGKA